MKVPEAERIAAAVCEAVSAWVSSQKSVTSADIFAETIKTMQAFNKDAAFLYETHRDVS
jgi:hypothetical protein